MPVLRVLRAYHAALAIAAITAYASAEWEWLHARVGYAVAALILLRVVLATSGAQQLGLMRFYPHFEGLKLGNAMTHPAISRTLMGGIGLCLLAVVGTGLMMDRGRTIGLGGTSVAAAAQADERTKSSPERNQTGKVQEALEELHELFGNLLMLVFALHVTYLLLFKRPLARFMLFSARPKASPRNP